MITENFYTNRCVVLNSQLRIVTQNSNIPYIWYQAARTDLKNERHVDVLSTKTLKSNMNKIIY